MFASIAAKLIETFFGRVFCWHPTLSKFHHFIRDWRELRALLAANRHHTARIENELYFYDCSVGFLASYVGLLYIFIWNLVQFAKLHSGKRRSPQGSTENNHGLKQFYMQPYVENKDRGVNNPTKWHFKCLKSTAFPCVESSEQLTRVAKLLQNKKTTKKMYAEYTSNIDATMVSHPDSKTEVTKGSVWDWNFLHGIGGENKNVSTLVPFTANIVNQLPLCTAFGFVFFSRIKPGTTITRHTGSTNLRLRIQLCLEVADTDNAENNEENAHLYAGNDKRGWTKHKMIIFDDSFVHGVNYSAKKDRVVLIIDIWNPEITEEERRILGSTVIRQFGRINARNTHALD